MTHGNITVSEGRPYWRTIADADPLPLSLLSFSSCLGQYRRAFGHSGIHLIILLAFAPAQTELVRRGG